MPRRFHAATFIVSRTCFLTGLLNGQPVRPWFAKAVQAVHTAITANVEASRKWSVGKEEDEIEDEYFAQKFVFPEWEYFVDNLGQVHPYPPGVPLAEGIYPNSGLVDEPFYIPANWQITPEKTPKHGSFTLRLRIRLHQHGICTPALYCQITDTEKGLTAEELVSLLRGMVDARPRGAPIFKVTTTRYAFKGTANDILNRALQTMTTGIFGAGYPDASLTDIPRLEPDYLLLDLGKTSPKLSLPADDEEIARLLSLSADPDRQLTHLRQAELGLYKTDWIGANAKHLLFCDTKRPWPARTRPQGYERDRGARRTLLRRGRKVWHMFRAVELVRAHKLLAQELNSMFKKSNLTMTRAKHRSVDFLKNFLTTTYYDDRPFTLALDLPEVRPKLFGRGKILFEYLAAIMGLNDAESRMKVEMTKFENQVNSWQPGITRCIDLFKVIKKPG